MERALELARRGEGFVEPNPQVGAVVLATDGRVVGEGWHERHGGPHGCGEFLGVSCHQRHIGPHAQEVPGDMKANSGRSTGDENAKFLWRVMGLQIGLPFPCWIAGL